MNEREFFAVISARLGRAPLSAPPHRTVIGVPDFWKQPDRHPPNVLEKFVSELENLGGQADELESVEQVQIRLSELLHELSPNRLGVWGHDFVESLGLQSAIQPYEVAVWGVDGVPEFQHVDVSISGCAYAIADTGTVVMMSEATRGRSVAVLPSVHIIILHASQIYPRMGDVLEEIAVRRDDLPSSIHFISGPSRSSDIENDQTIGIHGPARVIALIYH